MTMTGAVRDTLRQMLAVLEQERQALAGLDLDGILGAAGDKERLCGTLDPLGAAVLDDECRGMLDAARRLNEINRQVRNILAANVATRLNALTGNANIYSASGAQSLRLHAHNGRTAGRG